MTKYIYFILIAVIVLNMDFNSVGAEPKTVFIHTEQDVCGYDNIGLVKLSMEEVKQLIETN